jgi:hypothetical protein
MPFVFVLISFRIPLLTGVREGAIFTILGYAAAVFADSKLAMNKLLK